MVLAAMAGLAMLPAPENPASSPASTVPRLTPANFRTWQTYIAPNAKELAWDAIQWRPTMWEAVVEARRVQKPILLWAMNGHPMGCT